MPTTSVKPPGNLPGKLLAVIPLSDACSSHKLKKDRFTPNAENTLSQSRSMSPPVTGTSDVEELDSDVNESVVSIGACVAVGNVGVAVAVVVGVLVAVAAEAVTATRKLPESVLPASSVAEQLIVVVPRPNVEPEAGVQIGETEGSRLSAAEAE